MTQRTQMTQEEAIKTFLKNSSEILGVDTDRITLLAELLYMRGKSEGMDFMIRVIEKKHDK